MVIMITGLSSPVPQAVEVVYDDNNNNNNGNVLFTGLSSPVPQAMEVIYGHNNNWVVFSCLTSKRGNLWS